MSEADAAPGETRPCYVCEATVPIGPAQVFPDGSTYQDGLDENGHVLCKPHDEEAWAIFEQTRSWNSSEDKDLWALNCATEGLRRGLIAGRATTNKDQT